jgi:parallel beta-helix repeat protein
MGSTAKSFGLLLIVLFIASLVTFQSTTVKADSPKTIVVPDDYSDIQTAINKAKNGDTVFVKNGVYKYNSGNSITVFKEYTDGIFVNKSISLIGEDKEKTILTIDYFHGVDSTLFVYANDVTVSGFTITATKNIFTPKAFQLSGNNCTLTDNIFPNSDVVLTGKNNTISKNTFLKANVQVSDLYSSVFENNTITGNYRYGISLERCWNVTIRQNNIYNNGASNYTVLGNYPVPEYLGSGIALSSGSNFYIYENNITNNSKFGIQLINTVNNSSLHNNNIIGNGIGIHLNNFELGWNFYNVGLGNIVYYNNIISNGKNAVIDNSVYQNITADNSTFRGHVKGNGTDVVFWDNGQVGNYWSDYDGNGAYVIDENNIDHYPLIQQVDINSEAPTPVGALFTPLTIGLITIIMAVLISFLLFRRHRKKLT